MARNKLASSGKTDSIAGNVTSPKAKMDTAESKPKRSWRRTPPPDHTPSTREWVEIARRVLIEEGIVEVKIDKLAKLAGVTRGGFYWRFKSREELMDALIEDWRTTNTTPILRVLSEPGSLRERLERLADLYISEAEFSSAYDHAVRVWASFSESVAGIVHDVDEQRIAAIRQVFSEAGHSGDESLIRARITYFHQIGYYTARMNEPAETRQKFRDIYLRVLTGLG